MKVANKEEGERNSNIVCMFIIIRSLHHVVIMYAHIKVSKGNCSQHFYACCLLWLWNAFISLLNVQRNCHRTFLFFSKTCLFAVYSNHLCFFTHNNKESRMHAADGWCLHFKQEEQMKADWREVACHKRMMIMLMSMFGEREASL